MTNKDYKKIHEDIVQWIRDWFDKNGKGCNAIIGMSGGKDSTIVAALCAEALGKDKVIGIGMPDGRQGLNEADEICKYLGIRFITIPIGGITESFKGVWYDMGDEDFKWSERAEQNIPARVRMTVLYAYAQTMNGRVLNTCNLSEDYIGYATLFGDAAGDLAPIEHITVTDIRALGDEMGLPKKWIYKTPDDGLPHSQPDEEKLGFTYTDIDNVICGDTHLVDPDKCEKIQKMHKANQFKMDILHIPGPELA